MTKIMQSLWPYLVLGLLCFLGIWAPSSRADDYSYAGRLNSRDYLLGSQSEHRDPVFDKYRTVQLDAVVGVGSDCGRIDVKNTLRASLQNVLDSKYFGDMGKDIIAASPMLLISYLSPTWAAILKHSQLSAHWMSQMRLDQCTVMDKYVDSRVDEYYQERQSCVHQAIAANGGNLEQAMDSCGANNFWNADLSNWAGANSGAKVPVNRLIDSSAKWAGLDGPDAQSSLDLVKGLVGDTVISHGAIAVEYGPRAVPLTPRTYLQSLEKQTYSKLCDGLVTKVANSSDTSVDRLISDDDLKSVTPQNELLVDRATIRALARMSPTPRERACKKLSESIATTLFSRDVNRSLDILSTLSQNPNLPPQRKQEMEEKRRGLKDQIELTMELQRDQNEPLDHVLSQIHEQGERLQSESVGSALGNDSDTESNQRTDLNFLDCADGVMCPSGGN